MTCCSALLCDDRKSIVLVADKLISVGYIESELDVDKHMRLHRDWLVLLAGDDVTQAFDVIDLARKYIASKKISATDPLTLHIAMDAVQHGYQKKRLADAETLYLRSAGWTLKSFHMKGHALPDYLQMKAKVDEHQLGVDLLVAGFSEGIGHIFAISGTGQDRGLIQRRDIPGFHSIGSGAWGAIYMMYYREVSPKCKTREAVYYALEGKVFGEQASGVGERTDMFVATADGKFITIDDDNTIEKTLIPVCRRLQPSWMGKRDRDAINAIAELSGFDELAETPKPPKKAKKYSLEA